MFAEVEGMLFRMKRTLLLMHEQGQLALTRAEAAVLREEAYELTDKGKARVRKNYSKIVPALRFVVPQFGRVLGVEYEVPVDGPGWEAFRRALEVRNRVTHPRTLAEGDMSEADVEVVDRANVWFESVLKDVLNRAALARNRGHRLAAYRRCSADA